MPANETDAEPDANVTDADGEATDAAATAAEELVKAAADAEGNATAANATGGANASNATKMTRVKVEKERKRVHYTTLKAEATPFGRTLPMSEGLVKAALPSNTRPTSPASASASPSPSS